MTDSIKTARLGIDMGSTTVKIAVLDNDNNIIFSDYRHFSPPVLTSAGHGLSTRETRLLRPPV